MAPNLGWRDVPLGERLAQALDTPAPIFVANDADLGALVEHRRGAADRLRPRAVHLRRGRRRWRPDRRRQAAHRGGRLRRRGRPHARSTRTARRAAAGPSAAGRPRSARAPSCAWPAARRVAAGGEVDAVLREAEAGSPSALSALDHVGRWLGVGLAGLVNLLNPRLIVLGGVFGRIAPVRGTDDRGGAGPAGPGGAAAPGPGRPGARSAMDAPLLGAAELALEPLLADPAAWMAARDARLESASADARTPDAQGDPGRVGSVRRGW